LEYIKASIEKQTFLGFDTDIFLASYQSEAVEKALKSEKVPHKAAEIFKEELLVATKKIIEYLFRKKLRHDFFRYCSFLSIGKVTLNSAKNPLLELADLMKFPYDK